MPSSIKIFIGISVFSAVAFLFLILLETKIISLPNKDPASKTGFNYNLPINTQDPTLSQAGAFFFFEGVVTGIKPQDIVVVIGLQSGEGKPNTNKLEIPSDYKVKMTPRGGNADQTQDIQAKDIQVNDNIKVDFTYDFKLKKLVITQVLVTR